MLSAELVFTDLGNLRFPTSVEPIHVSVLICAQVGKRSLSFGGNRGMLTVGVVFRNPFTYQ